ncbi:hypothetical protein Tco_0563228 [Tanacetum coccineum]
MDDSNITMEEYIRLEEEKAHRHAIVFNDTITSEAALSCEPTVSSLNDEINFRISFDESDDEDFTPMVSYFDDLDYFNVFEKEFPAIVYNNAQTSKSDLLTELILNPQHIDEFNLKDKTSLSECDEEEQNVLNFNDLFPFNVIYPDELKTDTDNDNDKVDIEHSSGDLSVKPLPDVINTDIGAYAHGSNKLLETKVLAGRQPGNTVYTTYSLNEYSVYDIGINTVYPGDLVKEISTNIGGEFKYLEILKCWSLETSRRLSNTILLINATCRIYRANIRGVSPSNSF